MKAMIYIGHTKETLDVGGELLMKVLNSSAGDAVKIAAIESIAKTLTLPYTSITNCSFTGNQLEEKEERE